MQIIMSTIRGERIDLVRPKAINSRCIKNRKERLDGIVRQKHNTRSKTIKNHCGRVKEVCIQLTNGIIKGIKKGTHIDILNQYELSAEQVLKVGWLLDNGSYIWR